MMLAHTRQKKHRRALVHVGAATTDNAPNKYMTIGLVGSIGLALVGQFLPAAILLGSALGASAMNEGT